MTSSRDVPQPAGGPRRAKPTEPAASTRAATAEQGRGKGSAGRDGGGRAGFRADIQGLRAVAVSLVLIYHLWPNRLSGGFVGVDVFFVISGFLITSHLVSRIPKTIADLGTFWSKRIRRLLPAALLVLAVTLVVSRVVAPATQWDNTAREVIASALYVQNWRLAQTSVDYLAAESAASPVQHFWSLSVEEQFYLCWPILILLLGLIARRAGLAPKKAVLGGLIAVVAGSLAYSVYATQAEPASAYFVTPTRIWELGIGALLGVGVSLLIDARRTVLGRPEHPFRAVLAWLGFAAIAVTALTYTGETPFPGWRALLPVLGTGAVIAAAALPTGFSPTQILRWRPIQWLGDISYSVYLWHWPMVILLPAISGGHLGRLDKAVIIVASLVLASLTKKYVEDAFRFGRRVPSVRGSYALAAIGMSVVLALGGLQVLEVGQRRAQAEQELEEALSGGGKCFGAAALTPDRQCQPVAFSDIVPSPAQAAEDKSDAYSDDCWVYPPFPTTKSCTFGDPDGEVSIALLGNSHAGHWLPALQEIAKQRHWKITTFLASECTPITTPVEWDTPAKQSGCLKWGRKVQQEITSGDYDLVVTSNRNLHPAVGKSEAASVKSWQTGYREYLQQLSDANQKVAVIRDTPFPGGSIPDCVAENPEHLDRCGGRRDDWLPPDPQVTAAQQLDDPQITTVDLTNRVCAGERCAAVVGGVIVYFDGSHLTKTYGRTLAPYLLGPLTKALG